MKNLSELQAIEGDVGSYGRLTLASHQLCPYVQRATIVAHEKGIAFDRVVIDLGNKPGWFVERSPTGKVPLLMIGDITLFESAAIAEFLDEISDGSMLPRDPVDRARHRGWIAYASQTLDEIAGLYNAGDPAAFEERCGRLRQRFRRLGEALTGPWFDGEPFGLVDAAHAPIFRYLDAFERHAGLFLLDAEPGVLEWRERLAARPSVQAAAAPDYEARLRAFLLARGSYISGIMSRAIASAS